MSEDYAYRHYVPTYNGNSPDHEVRGLKDFDEPQHSIAIRASDGLVLDLESFADTGNNPNIIIERRPRGWVILIAPQQGDAHLIVTITDDPHDEGENQINFIREWCYRTKVWEIDNSPPELGMLPATPYAPQPPCKPFGQPAKPKPDRQHRRISVRTEPGDPEPDSA